MGPTSFVLFITEPQKYGTDFICFICKWTPQTRYFFLRMFRDQQEKSNIARNVGSVLILRSQSVLRNYLSVKYVTLTGFKLQNM